MEQQLDIEAAKTLSREVRKRVSALRDAVISARGYGLIVDMAVEHVHEINRRDPEPLLVVSIALPLELS
jgi:hypothetical protein